MPDPSRHVIIVGAGLAGSLLACYLSDRGWSVDVFERRPDPRAAGYAGGRSINLALSVRGLTGLRGAGLDEIVVERDAIRMPGRMLHFKDGHTAFQPYSADPADAINSVSRAGLNLTLINAAAARKNVRLHFDHRCVDADLAAPSVTFHDARGGTRRETAGLVVATDGAFSAVRLAFMTRTDRFDYSQSYLKHGYKELSIPGRHRGTEAHSHKGGTEGVDPEAFAMEPFALHIWPRGGAMMIALPNRDGSFTCTLFWPFEGEHSFERLQGAGPDAIRAFFGEHYPDGVPLMPTLAHDFAKNPTSSLVTVRCSPWQVGGKVCLVGDAAHAIVPFYGQGMNAAFEDCLVLARCLDAHAGDQRAALEEYQDVRKPNADAIADMAVENFVEMRDLAGRDDFQYRKKIEQAIHRGLAPKFGERVTPQYNLVSFSTVPYALAQRRGREMDGVLREIAAAIPPGSIADPAAWERAVIRTAEPLVARLTPISSDAALTA
jgi:kynurenine 3-monooxygenase